RAGIGRGGFLELLRRIEGRYQCGHLGRGESRQGRDPQLRPVRQCRDQFCDRRLRPLPDDPPDEQAGGAAARAGSRARAQRRDPPAARDPRQLESAVMRASIVGLLLLLAATPASAQADMTSAANGFLAVYGGFHPSDGIPDATARARLAPYLSPAL